jgi:hypothetical protein
MTTQQNNTDSKFEGLKLLYERNSDQFKYFLTWRQLMLAGYFAIIAALALGFKWALGDHTEALFAFPFAGAWISVLFWALDRRNRELYTMVSQVGAGLEEKIYPEAKGHFRAYSEKKARMGHGRILAVFYLGSGIVMFLFSIALLVEPLMNMLLRW